MKRLWIGTMALTLMSVFAVAQSLDDLNIQIHGYATQGFLYSSQNNVLTTNSSDGSPAWTEAVVNISAHPIPKLRVGAQVRYFLLGNLGNAITLDWAQAEYKVNNRFGVRFGKVKTPTGLFNEIQDIDSSYMWSLLPQGIYPIVSRNSLLSHTGGVVYGTLKLGTSGGELDYRAFGGERELAADDGYFIGLRESGIAFPNGVNGAVLGGTLKWNTPVNGLMVGASDLRDTLWSATMTDANSITVPGLGTLSGPFNGTYMLQPLDVPFYFGRYEKNKVSITGEWARLPFSGTLNVVVPALVPFGIPYLQTPFRADQRAWYGMASYKVTSKMQFGTYHSQSVNHQAVLGPSRYSKDWVLSARYDMNEFVYAKAEQHFLDGTEIGYDANANPGGINPSTRLTILKLGVSF